MSGSVVDPMSERLPERPPLEGRPQVGPERALNYGLAIRLLRTERGLSRRALAEASGVSVSYISEMERGLKRPTADTLAKLCHPFGLRPSELLEYVQSLTTDLEAGRPADHAAGALEPVAVGLETRVAAERAGERSRSLADLVSVADWLEYEDVALLLSLARRLLRKSR